MSCSSQSVGLAGWKLRSRISDSALGGRPPSDAKSEVDAVGELKLRCSTDSRRQHHFLDEAYIVLTDSLCLVDASHRPRAYACTMSSKYAFTTGLREVRFHLCHSSPGSEATRYVFAKRIVRFLRL